MLESELYLREINRMIKIIENSIKNKSYPDFLKDGDLIDASAMRLQVIGECSKKLESKYKKNREIWKRFEDIRDMISHIYNYLDRELIWDMLNNDIKKLKQILINLKT